MQQDERLQSEASAAFSTVFDHTRYGLRSRLQTVAAGRKQVVPPVTWWCSRDMVEEILSFLFLHGDSRFAPLEDKESAVHESVVLIFTMDKPGYCGHGRYDSEK